MVIIKTNVSTNTIKGCLPSGSLIVLLCIILLPASIYAQVPSIKIHLHGVYESKISLIPLAAPNALKTVKVIEGVKKGGTATLDLPAENLPGEFILRFDYKESIVSSPYPSEKRIVVGTQELELWVHPVYSNNPDSTWFQIDEKENTVYSRFLIENAKQKQKLGLLQNFLLNYDDTGSKFYRSAIKEYETRRKAFNSWIINQTASNKDLFVSSLFGFQHIPMIKWEGSEADRKKSLISNYFEGMNFSDSILIKTSGLKEWMDGYVNLYGEAATTVSLRDSLFTLAGKTAIEKAKNGHPLIYGWMVDYFFNGYESFNIQKGIQMLQPYLDDPGCLTSRRQQIEKRLNGISTLIPGSLAPEINMNDSRGIHFDLYAYRSDRKYILLLFWSADCSHCQESVAAIYPWSRQSGVQDKVEVVAISLDETETEITSWELGIKDLQGWRHLRAKEGLRSDVANDYFIIGIPVLVLLDSKTKEIVSTPDNAEEVINVVELNLN